MTIHNETPPAGSEPGSVPTGLKRVVAASMAGTVVEWYEFFLYGTAATLVFNKVFFPQTGSELDAIFAAFLTYAVGFFARPLGGIVFGHFGDKYGRKKLLQFSHSAGRRRDVPDGLPAHLRPDRVLGAGVARRVAIPPGLRRGRRVGWRGAAGGRAQPEPQPRVLGQLAAGRCTRRQHARHRGAPRVDRDAVGGVLPVVGMARRVLAVRRSGAHRLLHPHQGERRADIP